MHQRWSIDSSELVDFVLLIGERSTSVLVAKRYASYLPRGSVLLRCKSGLAAILMTAIDLPAGRNLTWSPANDHTDVVTFIGF